MADSLQPPQTLEERVRAAAKWWNAETEPRFSTQLAAGMLAAAGVPELLARVDALSDYLEMAQSELAGARAANRRLLARVTVLEGGWVAANRRLREAALAEGENSQ